MGLMEEPIFTTVWRKKKANIESWECDILGDKDDKYISMNMNCDVWKPLCVYYIFLSIFALETVNVLKLLILNPEFMEWWIGKAKFLSVQECTHFHSKPSAGQRQLRET